MRKHAIAAFSAILLTAALSASTLIAQDKPKPAGYQAITRPSMDVILSFDHPGRVAEILVDVGDSVKANQLVARQDDSEERAALAIDESKANDDTTIIAQQKIADEKAMSAKRMQASGEGVGSLELQDALLQADVEQYKVKLSTIQHQQEILKFKQTSIAVEKLKLYSPIDGIVAQRLIEKGESADGGNMRALRIVQLDPLRIEVSVPIIDARKLKEGNPAEISFSDKPRTGKIVRIFPVGDAGSETIIVRVEVPNPDHLSSGEKVFVNFTPAAPGVAKP